MESKGKSKMKHKDNSKKYISMIQFNHPRASALSSDSSDDERKEMKGSFVSKKYIMVLSFCAIVFCVIAFRFLSNLSVIKQVKGNCESYRKAIAESKKERKQLNGVSDSLESEVKQLELQIIQVNKDEGMLKGELVVLKREMGVLNEEFKGLVGSIQKQERDIEDCNRQSSVISKAINNLNDRLKVL